MITIETRMEQVREALTWAGIKTVEDPSVSTAYTYFADGAFTITLGRAYVEGTPEHRLFIALHELGHIARGDLEPTPGRELAVWNVAADACINHGLCNLIDVPAHGYISYQELRLLAPTLPPHVPTTQLIYEALLKLPPKNNPSCYKQAELTDPAYVDAWTRSAIASRNVLPGRDHCTIARPLPIVTERVSIAPIADILREIRSYSGKKRRVRSYMREGRVPCLRGVYRTPTPSVAVAIDTSGSISDLLLAREVAIVEAITSAGYTVHRYAFATTCAAWTGKTLPNVGRGTQLAPVIAATRQHPILLLCSDGYMDPIRQSDQLHIWVGGRGIKQQHGRHIIIPELAQY